MGHGFQIDRVTRNMCQLLLIFYSLVPSLSINILKRPYAKYKSATSRCVCDIAKSVTYGTVLDHNFDHNF